MSRGPSPPPAARAARGAGERRREGAESLRGRHGAGDARARRWAGEGGLGLAGGAVAAARFVVLGGRYGKNG